MSKKPLAGSSRTPTTIFVFAFTGFIAFVAIFASSWFELESALIQSIPPSSTRAQSSLSAIHSDSSNSMAAAAAAAAGSKATGQTMRAIVAHSIGGPEVLELHNDWPKPVATAGQVLIRVKAFGLNRAEMFTRQGHSPGVKFPRILGIEATGIVESAPGSEASLPVGSTVVTCMGDMGRMYDGGYAEYTLVKAEQVKRINVQGEVPWDILGALPETIQTAWGSLFGPLQLKKGDRLLIRGGTTTIGLAAAALAKRAGAYVVSTTRNESRAGLLREHGADDVVIDPTGVSIADEVARRFPAGGFDKILELVGTTSITDSMKCLRKGGITCMTGIAGGEWSMANFAPMGVIPKGTYMTTYPGDSEDLMAMPLDEIVQAFKDGEMKMPIRKFQMEEIVEAHKFLEHTGGAKAVVIVP